MDEVQWLVACDAVQHDLRAHARHFVQEQAGKPLESKTVATCMEILKKEHDDDDAVSMLVERAD